MSKKKQPTYEELQKRISELEAIIENQQKIDSQKSDDYYKRLFRNVNVDFAINEIIYDKENNPIDFKIIEVNRSFEESTGLKSEELIGKKGSEIFPNTEQYWIDMFGKVVQTGKSATYEGYSLVLNRYFELKVFTANEGEFAFLSSDVTEKRKAIKKMEEAKVHFELLFELNPDAVVIINFSDFTITNVNSGFCQALGYKKEEVIGQTSQQLNIWESKDARNEILHQLNENGYCSNYEANFRRKTGDIIVVMVSAKIIDINGTKNILIVSRDITLKKKFETALKENEKLLKTSQKIAGLGSYKLNIKTGYWESSEILDSIFGIDASYDKSIDGWAKIIHPDWREIMINYLQNEVIGKKQKFNKEYKVIRQTDLEEIWVHGIGELQYDTNGNLLYMSGTIMDITNRKRNEIIIQNQNSELRKLNTTKDLLFSIIAHDLRSPFNVLINSNDVLIEYLTNEDISEAKKWSSIINRISHQTLDLLENLLDWYKLESGKLTPTISTYDLKSIVEEITPLFTENASIKDIKINNHIIDSCLVHFDKNFIKTVLRNLINNAIKFTPNNGTISISYKKHNTEFEIIISDTGIGIPKEKISSLFEYNFDKTTTGTSNEQGSGLGLNLCKELIELLGGKIWVESIINKGSTFHFTIPITS